jgi:hypothetical protein
MQLLKVKEKNAKFHEKMLFSNIVLRVHVNSTLQNLRKYMIAYTELLTINVITNKIC